MGSREVHLLPLSVLLSIFFLAFFSSENAKLGVLSSPTLAANTADDFQANNVLEMVTQVGQRPPPPPRRSPPPPRRRSPPPPRRSPPPPRRRSPPPPRRSPPPRRRRSPPPPPRSPPPPPPSPPPPPPRSPPLPPPSLPPQFSAYRFILHWPPSLCSQVGVQGCEVFPPPSRFAIGGLVPSTNTGPIIETSIEYCNPRDLLDFSKIKELENELSIKWPALSSLTQRAHLGFQWSRYGTCSGLTQFQYFQTVLKLYDAIDLDNKLSSINVVPGRTLYNPYTVIGNYKSGLYPRIWCFFRSFSPPTEMIGSFEFRITEMVKQWNQALETEFDALLVLFGFLPKKSVQSVSTLDHSFTCTPCMGGNNQDLML